jgi:predicted RNase H-like nuclease (RuvC/YqgF family)
MPNNGRSEAAGGEPLDPADDRLRDANEQLTLTVLRVQEQAEELDRVLKTLVASAVTLQTKNDDLEKFHDMVVGRELRLAELEKHVTQLQAKLDQMTSEARPRKTEPSA